MFCSRCGTEVDNQARFCPSCGLDLATTTPLAAVQPEKSDENELDVVREALQDEWVIEKELGRGGMAIVFKARDKHLDRDVAIKVLPFSLSFDAEFVERFQREARTAAKLEHAHIIPIYRVGRSGRVIYFVMKFLRGRAMSELLAERGTLAPAEIRRVLVQTAGALGYAHSHGIVHRDIKPDNIMFDEVGNAVVTDFGIAKAATGSRLTGTGMSIGTPHYMSPEQARAQPLDGRSDIYSLGVVAFQALTGTVPFDGEDAFSIGYKHIMEEVPTPQLQTGEQRALMGVVRRMMAKSPNERFQDTGELVAALEGRFRTPSPSGALSSSELPTTMMPQAGTTPATPVGTARPRSALDAMPTTPTTPIPKAQVSPAKEKKRSGVLVGMLAVLALGVGGAGGYWYFAMGAEWPPTFGNAGAAVAADSVGTDSLALAAGDTVTLAAADSAGADSAVGDTARTPASELPPTGVLLLTGVPSLAQVTVDGEPQTETELTVDPGSKRIQVTKTGFDTFTTTVPVGRGDTVKVAVSLSPQAAAPPAARPTTRPTRPVDYCTDPTAVEEYNGDGSCFQVEPRATAAPLVPVAQEVFAQNPTPVVLWVKVRSDGQAEEIKWVRQSNVRAFSLAAARFAMGQMTYTAAERGGQAVDAWVRLALRARPQR
ncbi:MAG: protein kinase [Gemmatimonadota bacterium]|nr:MAG: protein kinase [Gemmatimonadota bacterium]